MSAPAPGTILYRFSPPTDSWTGTYVDPPYEDFEDEIYAYSEVTDTYDFRNWSPSGFKSGIEAYIYKQATNSGIIQRIKFTFSVCHLPDFDSYLLPLVTLSYANTMDANPKGGWAFDTNVIIDGTGHLWLYAYEVGTMSTYAVSGGTSYDVEIYIYNDPGETKTTWRIYIDNDLWLEDNTLQYIPYSSRPYVQLTAGLEGDSLSEPMGWEGWTDPPGNYGAYDHTLHMEDIVWTIENPSARWTMMAIGI